MSRVVIVGRTHMHGGHVCIGGHDMDHGVRNVRLFEGLDGQFWTSPDPFEVDDLWEITYRYIQISGVVV
jgi:hypothetical protein